MIDSPQPPPDSRYRRSRRPISWVALILGIILGTAGGIFYAWNLAPIEEVNTAPWQLNAQGQADYLVAVMLNYQHDADLTGAVGRLLELRISGDPIQYVADTACNLARSGYVDSASGERAIRAMMSFYRNQGRTGCADALLPGENTLETATPQRAASPTSTEPPPPTKTITPTLELGQPTATQEIRVAPTVAPQQAFSIVRLERFCDADFPGVLEVYVQERDGSPIAGQRVRVTWRSGQSAFITGVKPGRGRDYADFLMESDISYTVEMPGQSDPSQVFSSTGCVDPTGQNTLASYRAVFRPVF
jgi:hypothetical protein